MDADQILVPYSFTGDKGPFVLCSVECVEFCDDKSWQTNGETQRITNKLFALKQYFERKCDNKSGREIAIIPLEKSNGEAELTDTTDSVFLGIFLKAAQEILQRKIKKDWDFVIATGDIKPTDDGLEPEVVSRITEKFESVKKLAQYNPDKKILFVCVHDEEKPSFEPEYPKNITVKVFTKQNTFGEILAAVFEPKFDGEQKRLFRYTYESLNWHQFEYIPNKNFNELKETFKIHCKTENSDWNGVFIHGMGERGKSAMALELTNWLMENEFIYAPIWIKIDNKRLLDSKNRSKLIKKGNNKYKIKRIQQNNFLPMNAEQLNIDYNDNLYFVENIVNIMKTLKDRKKQYLLVIDNLECDLVNINEILKELKNIILKWELKPFVIITSRIKKEPPFDNDEIELDVTSPSLLSIDEVDNLIKMTIKKLECEYRLNKCSEQQYYEFKEKIHEHFKELPGIIKQIISLLRDMEIAELQPILLSLDEMSLGEENLNNKIIKMYETILNNLDAFTQAILYSFIGNFKPSDIEYYKHEIININLMKKDISDRLIKSGILLNDENGNKLSETKINSRVGKSIKELELRHFIFKVTLENNEEVYEMKSLTYITLVFNPKLTENIPYIDYLRDILLNKEYILYEGIYYSQPVKILEPIIKKLVNKKDIKEMYHLHMAASFSTMPEHIDLLIKYKYDVNLREKMEYMSPLHCAINENAKNIDIIKKLIQYNTDITIKDKHGYTPLHFAAIKDKKNEIIPILLEKNKSIINIQNNYEQTALHLAAGFNENPESIKMILQKGGIKDIEKKDIENTKPLQYAVVGNKNSKIAIILINAGADIWIKDKYGASIIHYAVKNPYLHQMGDDLLTILINKGLDINSVDSDGWTPLHCAAGSNENPENIKMILRKGGIKDINKIDIDNWTPLHCAVNLNTNPKIAITLIEAGADIWIKDEKGASIIHYAAKNPYLHQMEDDLITILINKGLNINSADLNGWTPLHYAAIHNESPESVKIVLQRGGINDINKKDNNNFTPLQNAVGCNANSKIAITLIEAGADIWFKDEEEDFNVLHCAGVNPYLHQMEDDLITILINKGLDINSVDSNGYTIIHIAAEENENHESVAFLLAKYKIDEINIKDNLGHAPLHKAAENENPRIAIEFIKAGASLKIKDNEGKTPLDYLKEHKDWKFIEQAINEMNKKPSRNKF